MEERADAARGAPVTALASNILVSIVYYRSSEGMGDEGVDGF